MSAKPCPNHRHGRPVMVTERGHWRVPCHGTTPDRLPCNLQAGHPGECE